MSGTLGPTRRGRRGRRGRRRPPGRRSPRAIAAGDGVASFPLSSRCGSLECHRHLLTAKMKTCSSPCLTPYRTGETLSTAGFTVSQKTRMPQENTWRHIGDEESIFIKSRNCYKKLNGCVSYFHSIKTKFNITHLALNTKIRLLMRLIFLKVFIKQADTIVFKTKISVNKYKNC